VSKGNITHVYSAKNKLHMREMVPANELVFIDRRNIAVSVYSSAHPSIGERLEEEQTVSVPARKWWQIIVSTILSPNQTVIYHGGYWAKIWWVVLLCSIFRIQQVFVSWGGELVAPATTGGRYAIRHIVKRIAVRRLFAVVFLSESDAELGRKAHPKIRHHGVIPYFNERHSRRVNRGQVRKTARRQNEPLVIFQVGNDASEANDHLACLDCVDNIDIYKTFIFPMNYGRSSEKYIDTVLSRARNIIHSRVEVIENILTPDGFDEIIERCDAFLIGSKSQRSLYSIYAYLSSGKPVFLPEHSDFRRDLIDAGFEIEALESIQSMTPENFLKNVNHFNKNNVLRVHELLGLDSIREKWHLLLRSASVEGAGVAKRSAEARGS
jgi:hypothetical protein